MNNGKIKKSKSHIVEWCQLSTELVVSFVSPNTKEKKKVEKLGVPFQNGPIGIKAISLAMVGLELRILQIGKE